MKRTELPSQDVLNEMFNYDAETGKLYISDNAYIHAHRGKEAGTISRNGYLRVSVTINGKRTQYMAHRVIWKMLTGEDPDTIDHINFDRLDNRICNLRDGTQAQNNYHTQKSISRGYHYKDREYINQYNRERYAKFKRKGVKGYIPPIQKQ